MTTQYAGIYNPINNTLANRTLFLSLLQNDPELHQYLATSVNYADAGYTMVITFTNPINLYTDLYLIQYIADLNFNGMSLDPNYEVRTVSHAYLPANPNHDARLGFSIGSYMSYPGQTSTYVCYDNAVGAAVWKNVCIQNMYFNSQTGIANQDFIKISGFTATEAEAQYLITGNMLIKNLAVKVTSGTALNSGSRLILRINGVETPLAVTGDGSTNPLINTVDIVPVSSMDLISIKFVGMDTGKILSVTIDQI